MFTAQGGAAHLSDDDMIVFGEEDLSNRALQVCLHGSMAAPVMANDGRFCVFLAGRAEW
jgi:hypothetical protein